LELSPHAVVGRVGPGGLSSGGIEIGAYSPGEPEREGDYEGVAEPDRGVIVFEPGMTIEDMERQAIQAALSEVGGNRRRAADMLGIGERTLYRKISKYGLEA
jgi:DNA-binding NtrC family response regulator